MNRVDLSRTVSVQSGTLSLLAALENAAQFLRDAEDCTLVCAASERLDAILSDIHEQQQAEAGMNTASSLGVTMAAGAAVTHATINAGPSDILGRKSKQLAALLTLFYGECGETFRCLPHETQDAAQWLAADLGNEVMMLAELAVRATLQQKGGEA